MASHTLTLCLNCLEQTQCYSVPVGPDKGSQRDPYQDRVSLCSHCKDALLAGKFTELAKRNRTTITIERRQ